MLTKVFSRNSSDSHGNHWVFLQDVFHFFSNLLSCSFGLVIRISLWIFIEVTPTPDRSVWFFRLVLSCFRSFLFSLWMPVRGYFQKLAIQSSFTSGVLLEVRDFFREFFQKFLQAFIDKFLQVNFCSGILPRIYSEILRRVSPRIILGIYPGIFFLYFPSIFVALFPGFQKEMTSKIPLILKL